MLLHSRITVPRCLKVEVLSLLLSCDLSHISGARIVEGNLEDISNTLELLSALCQGKPLLGKCGCKVKARM